MYKKGVSDVVATVIIVALVIVAITVVWLGVMPLIRDKLGGFDVCNNMDVSIETAQGYTCWASDKNITLVQIKKGSSVANISKVKFAISSFGNSVSYTNITNFQRNSYSIFYLNTTGFSGIDKVEVVPYVKSGNSEKACSSVSIENLKSCGSVALSSTEVAQIISSGSVSNQDTTSVNGNTEYVLNPPINPPTQTGFECNSQNDQGFYNGTGTLVSPFGICNCTMLQNMKNYLAGKNYVLLSNIDCSVSKGWNGGLGFEPIGRERGAFYGKLNGKGYSISNLYINRPGEDNVGLFGYTWGAEILDVGLINVNVTGRENVGGLVGYQYAGVISNCYSIGNVSGSSYCVGGLVGYQLLYCSINNSFSYGSVFSSSSYVGGLVGCQQNNNIFINSSYSVSNVTGSDYVGGLIGYSNSNTAVVINNSYSLGNVNATTTDYWGATVGGFVGVIRGTVYNSYSVGKVTGKVGSPDKVGGFVGDTGGSVWLPNSNYWDNETSGQSRVVVGSGIGKPTIQMKMQSTFQPGTNNWDFNNIWAINSVKNNGYPYLRWQNL
jgi:hypothetical protein